MHRIGYEQLRQPISALLEELAYYAAEGSTIGVDPDVRAHPKMMSALSPVADLCTPSNTPEGSHSKKLRRRSGKGTRLESWSSESGQSVQSTSAGETESEGPCSPNGIATMVGRVRRLAHSPEGTRRLQNALDNASSKERELLVKEFHGRAVRAMRCPHANHVLQKIISVMPPASLQFLIDEIMGEDDLAKKLTTHRYGGRIVQQLLAKCSASQVGDLVETLLQDTAVLSCHYFGNFAIQHLLQSGTAEQQYRCIRSIERNMKTIASSTCGVGVVEVAMRFGSPLDRAWLARALIQAPELLFHLAQTRHGPGVVSHTMGALPKQERARTIQILSEASRELRATRYGKKVLASLEGYRVGIADADNDCASTCRKEVDCAETC